MTAARRPLRRPQRWLRGVIRTLLADQVRPVGAAALAHRVAALHPNTYVSNVFRALAGMLADGEVHRVEIISGYTLPRAEPTIDLVCRRCGDYRAAAGAPDAALAALARARGFEATRFIAEVKGRCPNCAGA